MMREHDMQSGRLHRIIVEPADNYDGARCVAEVVIDGLVERFEVSKEQGKMLLAAWGPPPRGPLDIEVSVGACTIYVILPGRIKSITTSVAVDAAARGDVANG